MTGDEWTKMKEKPSIPSGHKLDSMFCVQDEDGVFPEIPTIKSHTVSSPKGMLIITGSKRLDTKSPKQSFKSACEEFTADTAKAMSFFKKKFKGRKKEQETEVTDIHITQQEDDSEWSERQVNSAASRTSTDTAYSSGSTGSKDDGIEVVHDMANEEALLW